MKRLFMILLAMVVVIPSAWAQDFGDGSGMDEGEDGRKRFTPEQAQGIVSSLISPYDFSGDQRKDPFLHPEILSPPDSLPPHGPFMPLQQFDISALRVRAILWSVRQPRALIEAPGGNTYAVTLGDRLGNKNGYVALIREGEVVVVETEDRGGETVSSTQVLTIAR